jgi:hypothetical protein
VARSITIRVHVRRTRQCAVVGHDVLAERHADRQLPLVVALVGVQLGSGGIPRDPQPVGDAQPAVARVGVRPRDRDAVVLHAEVAQRELPADREQDHVPLGGRAVGEVDHVRAVLAGAGPGADGAATGQHDGPVALQREANGLRVAGVLGRDQARTRLHDRRRDAEPHEDLGELAAGRPAAEDEQALRQLAGERRLLVGPGMGVGEALDRRDPGRRANRDDHVPCAELGHRIVAGRHRDPPRRGDPAGTAEGGRACALERRDMRAVVRLGGPGRAVDHVVATLRGTLP